MTPDYDLLQAWGRGDGAAGDELVRRHYRRVFGFIRSKIDIRPQDLVQRTFLICLERHEHYRRDASFSAFLLGIARRVVFDYFRELRKDRHFDASVVSVADLAARASTIVVQREEERILLGALRAIPLDFQITIELFYWEGISMAEIAEILGVAEGTVKSRLHRAKELLRKHIAAVDAQEALLHSTLNNLDRWARGLQALLGERDAHDSS